MKKNIKYALMYLKNKRTESIVTALVILMVTCIFSVALYFQQSDQIEKALLDQVTISFDLYNNHIMSKYYGQSSSALFEDSNKLVNFYSENISALEKLAEEPEVSEYNYNIVCSLNGISEEYEILGVFEVIGVNTVDFQKNEIIELVSGRFFTDEELKNGMNKIIVPEGAMVYNEDKTAKYIKVGDHIDISTYQYSDEFIYQGYGLWTTVQPLHTESVEVIGIYKQRFKYDYSNGFDDLFTNSDMSLLPNRFLIRVLKNTYYTDMNNEIISCVFNGDRLSINRISFTLDNYEHYYVFRDKFNTCMDRINNLSNENFGLNADTVQIPQQFSSVMQSIVKTRNIYNTIFTAVFLISVIMFVLIMVNFIRQKTAEVSILYSLGNSKLSIIGKYAVYYSLISIVGLLIGIPVGYVADIVLINGIVNDNVEIQKKLIKYANNGIEFINTEKVKILSIDPSELLRIAAIISAVIILVVLITTIICMSVLMIGNLKDKLARE